MDSTEQNQLAIICNNDMYKQIINFGERDDTVKRIRYLKGNRTRWDN